MQMKITEKDKKLLSILASVLILVMLGWYVVMPAYERTKQKKQEIEMAEMEVQEMDMKIAMYPGYSAEIDGLKQRTAEATSRYYDRMSSQEVDRELTGIVLANDLECVNLNIQPLVFAEESPYVRSDMAAAEAQEQAEGGSASSGEGEEVQDQVYTCKVSMTVAGGDEALQRLVDLFVNDSPSIRVTSLSYQEGNTRMRVQEDGSMVEEEPKRQLVLNLNIYMCDKSLYGQAQPGEGGDSLDALSERLQSLITGGGGSGAQESETENATEAADTETEDATEAASAESEDATEAAGTEGGTQT